MQELPQELNEQIIHYYLQEPNPLAPITRINKSWNNFLNDDYRRILFNTLAIKQSDNLNYVNLAFCILKNNDALARLKIQLQKPDMFEKSVKKNLHLLCDPKTDLNKRIDIGGDTLLMWASWGKLTGIVYFLLKKKVDVNKQSDAIETTYRKNVATKKIIPRHSALILACENGCIPIVKMLLAHQADPNLIDNLSHKTALQKAVEEKHIEVIKILIAHPATTIDEKTEKFLDTISGLNYKKPVKKYCSWRCAIL